MDQRMDFEQFSTTEAENRLAKVRRHRRSWHDKAQRANENTLEHAVTWVNRLMNEDSFRPDTTYLLRRILQERKEMGLTHARP